MSSSSIIIIARPNPVTQKSEVVVTKVPILNFCLSPKKDWTGLPPNNKFLNLKFFLDATGYGSIRKLKTSIHVARRRLNYRFRRMTMNWAQRKIYLYNVTFGLYMPDPWERYLFNALVVVLMWFIFYNGYRNLNEICKRYVW